MHDMYHDKSWDWIGHTRATRLAAWPTLHLAWDTTTRAWQLVEELMTEVPVVVAYGGNNYHTAADVRTSANNINKKFIRLKSETWKR